MAGENIGFAKNASVVIMKATIFDIQRNSFVDAPGIRTTVFFKGCNLKCKWCHNPESQSAQPQILFYKNKCTGCGRCKNITADDTDFICFNDAKEICGKIYTVDEVLHDVIKDKAFYETSGGGVTFSGGECMLQIDFLKDILKKCKENGIHTAVDTAGNVPWKSFEKIMPHTDLFLYDVKCVSERLHIDGTDVSNKLILENLKKLSDNFGGDIIIRIPVMKGFNDDVGEMRKIADFLKDIRIKTVELLPYHKMGEHKYDALDMECVLFDVPDKDMQKVFKSMFCWI